MEKELVRSNKITVKANEVGFTADFYRTHKHLLQVASPETGWVPSEDATPTGKRESFRVYVIENAEIFGISWKPEDMRESDNIRMAHYSTDKLLEDDAIRMLIPDLREMVSKCRYAIEWHGVEVEEIIPKVKTSKGTMLTALGIVDGKYTKSGNWAWADIIMTAVLKYHGEEVYLKTGVELISGQLKKPKLIITSFNESIKKALDDAKIIPDEDKEVVVADTTAKNTKAEVLQHEQLPTKTELVEAANKVIKAKKSKKGDK